MSSEYQILRGFPFSGRGIDITAQKSCTGSFYQKGTIIILGNRLIGGRQIRNNCSSHQCMRGRRRLCHPQIFAELTSQYQLRKFLTPEQQVGSERNHLFSQTIFRHRFLSRCEMSAFIELRIHRDIFLRNHSQYPAPVQYRSHIVQTAVLVHGKSHQK